jgi:hypothetical protein
MEAAESSETSVDLRQAALPHIPDDSTRHSHKRDNVVSGIEVSSENSSSSRKRRF